MCQFMWYASGEGCSQTLHKNYLLPINSKVGQDEKDAPMAGIENTNPSTPAPPVDSEPADAGPSGMVTSSTAGSTPQDSLDQPASLRCGTWNTQNWLPWRYRNFSLQVNTRLPNVWDAWAGLHAISSLYNAFWGSTVWIHSTYTITCLQSATPFSVEGNPFNVVSVVDFLVGGGVDWRLFGPSTTAPPENKFQESIPIETQGVYSNPTQKIRWWM